MQSCNSALASGTCLATTPVVKQVHIQEWGLLIPAKNFLCGMRKHWDVAHDDQLSQPPPHDHSPTRAAVQNARDCNSLSEPH